MNMSSMAANGGPPAQAIRAARSPSRWARPIFPPVATPPNAIVFGSGRIKISEMAKVGLWINLIGVLVITGVFFLIGTALFSIDLSSMPAWANFAGQGR